MRGVYFGGYPWKDGGALTAADLNAAIALALSPVSIIQPGSITNVMLANPYVIIGTSQINLGQSVNTLHGVLDPVNDLDVANKHYVDQHAGSGGGGAGINDAPADGNWYGRYNAGWQQVIPIAGGVTITGGMSFNGMLNANGGLTVLGGSTVSGGQIINSANPPSWQARTANPAGLPPTSGSAAASSTVGRFADTSGPCLDVGSNGVSGFWLDCTNSSDHTQRYPLLLQVRGGETRMGGTTTMTGALTVNAGTQTAINVPNGGITVAGVSSFPQGVTLGAPLNIASGGTNNTSFPLPPNLPGVPAWSTIPVLTSGTNFTTTVGALGWFAKTAGYNICLVGITQDPIFNFYRLNGTAAAPTAVASGNLLAGIYGNGYDGNTITGVNAAAIQFVASSNWSQTNHQSSINFWTTNNNFTNPANTMTLTGNGDLFITGTLHASGGAYASGYVINNTDHYMYDGGSGTLNFRAGPTGGPDAYFSMKNNGQFVTTTIQTNNISFASYLGHTFSFEWNGANLVAHVDGTNSPGALAAIGTNVSFNGVTISTGGITNSGGYSQSGTGGNTFTGGINANGGLSVSGGGFSANAMTANSLQLNGGGTALYVPSANATINNLTLSGGGATVLNVTSGGISVAGASTFNQPLTVAGTSTFTGLQLNGGGTTVLNVPSGGITVGGLICNGGTTLGNGMTVNAGTAVFNGGGNAISCPNGNVYSAGQFNGGSCFLSGGGDTVLNCANGGITVGAVTTGQVVCSGNAYKPGGGPWTDSSDIRLKQNVADYTTGLTAINALRPVTFEFNGLAKTVSGIQYVGLVADEAMQVMPEMVHPRPMKLHPDDTEDTDVLQLDPTALTYALINAVKELTARVAALEAR